MNVLIVADEPLLALSLKATLDLGGHKVLGPAATPEAALALAAADRPGLALVHLGLRNGGGLAHALRDRFGVPSLLVGADAACTRADRGAAWGLIRDPRGRGSRTVLRAVGIALRLGEGRGPRGRLPREIELFYRPARRGAQSRRSNVAALSPATKR